MQVRTRFAPSPTGDLHIGGARTALFCWAYARHHGGVFILRIEDSDMERSKAAATQGILDGMQWLGLDYDEGPYYQSQRQDRYREVAEQMLLEGTAYRCYLSADELSRLREAQLARGEKPRYDLRYRPEEGKTLPPIPVANGVAASSVIRFKNPLRGQVRWQDQVKGEIVFANEELDDFILVRSDGTPTYNFCVVVDDMDMKISHVIRGDDHVNNTPRQINLFHALGVSPPEFAHLPMILGMDGQKLSKRHGAVSVMQYQADGYLPEAVINYLARLGWSHGDEELFTREQLQQWFDLSHVTPSAARFDFDKLDWVNAHHLKAWNNEQLAKAIAPRLTCEALNRKEQSRLLALVALYRERAATLKQLAQALEPFFDDSKEPVGMRVEQGIWQEHLQPNITATLLAAFAMQVQAIAEHDWQPEGIKKTLKQVCEHHQAKLPQLAIPLRLLLLGEPQSPAIDQVLSLFERTRVLERIHSHLAKVQTANS